MPQSISMPPQPSALVASLRSIGYTLETAIADIIDNSITAKAKKVSIRFAWNQGDPWLAIIDDGYGMSKKDLLSAMRFGSKDPTIIRDPSDLGRFGMGMKTASISQCRKLTVLSKTNGMVSATEWNLDALSSDYQSGWLLISLDDEDILQDNRLSSLLQSHLSNVESGTIVLWRNLDVLLQGENQIQNENAFNNLLGKQVQKHISTTFHRFLSPNSGYSKLTIDFNAGLLEGFNPFGRPSPKRQELSEEVINLPQGKIHIQPYILPHKNKIPIKEYESNGGDEGYLYNQGFYVYRNRRLILKSTWFRLIKKQVSTQLIRVRIDIPNSLDHLWSINVNKSEVSPPVVVKNRLKTLIGEISDKGKRVYKQRAVTLQNKTKFPIWKRVLKENNKVKYAVNDEHPLIQSVLNEVAEDKQKLILSSFSLLADEFPYHILFNDMAADDVEIEEKTTDDEVTLTMYRSVIAYLKSQDVSNVQIIEQVHQFGLPSLNPKTLESLLTQGNQD
jgi:hypothetical protein